jgi:putative YhdH/YhfP family quinone oxidoreductase
MSTPKSFPAFVVNSTSEGDKQKTQCVIRQMSHDELDAGEVVVRVTHSALNYKDALASIGNRGVARKLPLVPGVDAVGEVIESESTEVKIGDVVIVAAAEFGTAHHGGLAGIVRVPANWVFAVPNGLSPIDAVTWGTAGFTAAQSVEQITKHGVTPDSGEVLVTGATGGVGIFAVKLLAQLGYEVVAVSGKAEKHDWLKRHGAHQVIGRSDVCDETDSPLLKSRWAAAVDSVGGKTLATILRSAKLHSCVTACGLVGGHELDLTVYPFILRGVTLCGIDSANISRQTRVDLWNKIANDWAMDLSELRKEITLEQVGNELQEMLAGNSLGRSVVGFENAS